MSARSSPLGFESRGDERALSTTLDVTLCLLLVSAAVGVLAATGPTQSDHDPTAPDRAVERLATVTVTVDYVLPGEAHAPASARQRTVHATPARLLARTAVDDLALDELAVDGGNPDAASNPNGFEAAVVNQIVDVLADVGASANVTATYAPCPGAGVGGREAVGPAPPGDVDVSVARIRVPVSAADAPAGTDLERAASEDGFAEVARAIADATLAVVVPPSRTRWGLRDPATSAVVASRYRGLAASFGVDVDGALAGSRVGVANDRLADALAKDCEVALRERFDSPSAAATAASPGTVTIAVRTWSA